MKIFINFEKKKNVTFMLDSKLKTRFESVVPSGIWSGVVGWKSARRHISPRYSESKNKPSKEPTRRRSQRLCFASSFNLDYVWMRTENFTRWLQPMDRAISTRAHCPCNWSPHADRKTFIKPGIVHGFSRHSACILVTILPGAHVFNLKTINF
jgi:hypothetical protein